MIKKKQMVWLPFVVIPIFVGVLSVLPYTSLVIQSLVIQIVSLFGGTYGVLLAGQSIFVYRLFDTLVVSLVVLIPFMILRVLMSR